MKKDRKKIMKFNYQKISIERKEQRKGREREINDEVIKMKRQKLETNN